MSAHHDINLTQNIARNIERVVMEIAKKVGVHPDKIFPHIQPEPNAKPASPSAEETK